MRATVCILGVLLALGACAKPLTFDLAVENEVVLIDENAHPTVATSIRLEGEHLIGWYLEPEAAMAWGVRLVCLANRASDLDWQAAPGSSLPQHIFNGDFREICAEALHATPKRQPEAAWKETVSGRR